VTTAAVGEDGSFTAPVPAVEGRYRARAGEETSPVVELKVLVHPDVSIALHRHRRTITVSGSAAPVPEKAVAALQVYSRERFAWRQIDSKPLPASGRVRFSVSAKLRRTVRIAIRRERRGEVLGASRGMRTWVSSRQHRG
jgi:hypothetical protein